MASIKVLSPEVSGKIAAGEVITRPASVVKELLENALDAGAQRIDLMIQDGGKQNVLVNDNGSGISPDDVELAVQRFSTSKIHTINDIDAITTYGFRGEALASIAQVAHLEIETSNGEHGTKLVVLGGCTKEKFESCRPQGTRITVTNLFYNLPARLKFLKSAQWEKKLIIDLLHAYALICPKIHFTMNDGNREVHNYPPSADLVARSELIFPRVLRSAMVSVRSDISNVSIQGMFTRPDFQERHHIQYISVNKRPVKYSRIYRTIMQTYQEPKIPPAFVLHIRVDPALLDVNIHPTKREVKFHDERYIMDILTQTLKTQIFRRSNITIKAPAYYPLEAGGSSSHFVQDSILSVPEEKHSTRDIRDAHEFWQVHNMYVLAQTSSGLIIVDQHAAHERILYETVMMGKTGSQRLLFPITLDLTPEEYRAYKKTKNILKELGIDFKEFSSRTVVIDSLPTGTQVHRDTIHNLFKDIDGLGNLIKEKSEIAKVIACHTAIKAGQQLSEIEMQDLVDKLFACEHPYTCPHGRPTVIRYSMEDLAVKFGRT